MEDPAHLRIHRKFSIYLTWLLLRLHPTINPNTVTAANIFLILPASLLLLQQNNLLSLLGALLFYLIYLLDHTDGEIARYKQQYSSFGVYLDEVHHMLGYAAFFTSLGIKSWQAGESFGLSLGLLAALLITLNRLNMKLRTNSFWSNMARAFRGDTSFFIERPPRRGLLYKFLKNIVFRAMSVFLIWGFILLLFSAFFIYTTFFYFPLNRLLLFYSIIFGFFLIRTILLNALYEHYSEMMRMRKKMLIAHGEDALP